MSHSPLAVWDAFRIRRANEIGGKQDQAAEIYDFVILLSSPSYLGLAKKTPPYVTYLWLPD